ncbi:MAG: hypothetical protein VX836_06590 [Pseudomonadota bacterium]|nr:hypothetical protein [Pseudomonadota bacterium]
MRRTRGADSEGSPCPDLVGCVVLAMSGLRSRSVWLVAVACIRLTDRQPPELMGAPQEYFGVVEHPSRVALAMSMAKRIFMAMLLSGDLAR